MVQGFAFNIAVGIDAVNTGISDVRYRCHVAVQMHSGDGGRHRGKLGKFAGHLIDGLIRSFYSYAEYLLRRGRVAVMRKRLAQYLHRHLRGYVAGLSSADAVRHGKYAFFAEYKVGVLIGRSLFT